MSLVDRFARFRPVRRNGRLVRSMVHMPIDFRLPLPGGPLVRSELPPDRHWQEPLRRAAGAEHPEVVSRDQKPGRRESISDTDTGTKPGSHRIGSRFPIREPAHTWAKAEKPRCNRY